MLDIVFCCQKYIKDAPTYSHTNKLAEEFASELLEIWTANRSYLKTYPKINQSILRILTALVHSKNSQEITDFEEFNFNFNERKGMLEFIQNPPGTVFKSAVALLEMTVFEPIILKPASIDKLDMDLLKAFIWVNLFYTGRIALAI